MLLTDRIPEYIFKSLESEGANRGELMLATYCDMNSDHVFCDTYILASCKKLYVISGVATLEKQDGKRAEKIWREESFKEYDIEKIESLKCEEMLSSARFTAKLSDGEYAFLTALTNTCRSSVLLFIKYFERMKKGEISSPDFEIDKEDDPKERCCPKCGMRYPDKNRKVCPRCMEKGKLYRRFGMFLGKYKGYVLLILMSLILLTAMSILAPYFSNEFFYDEACTQPYEYDRSVVMEDVVLYVRPKV